MSDFDFEKWAKLARNDPVEFEKERKRVIEETIMRCPPHSRQRLIRLQWRIDMERKRCKNPLQSCIRLFDMMMDFVHSEGGFLSALETLKRIGTSDTVPCMKSGTKVIPFRTGKACMK